MQCLSDNQLIINSLSDKSVEIDCNLEYQNNGKIKNDNNYSTCNSRMPIINSKNISKNRFQDYTPFTPAPHSIDGSENKQPPSQKITPQKTVSSGHPDHGSWSLRVNGETHTLASNFSNLDDCISYINKMTNDYSLLKNNENYTIDNKNQQLFKTYLTELSKTYGKGKGEEIAKSTANGFTITSEMLLRDTTALKNCNNSLSELILTNFKNKKKDGFLSGDTVKQVISHDDPEFDALYNIAEHGAVFRRDTSFIPNNTPTNPLRELQRRMPHTFMKHCHKLWEKKRGLLLRY